MNNLENSENSEKIKNSEHKPKITVTNLFTYPIKSCHENNLRSSVITPHGLLNDRKLLIINKTTLQFVTIRTHPQMYWIKTKIFEENFCSIEIPNNEKPFLINTLIDKSTLDASKILKIKIWKIPAEVYPVENEELTKALSDYLNLEVLIVLPITERKLSDFKPKNILENFKESDTTFFADLAPILITSVESFNYLNKIVQTKGDNLQMINFRPNIVLQGGEKEFWEDNLNKIKIGDVVLRRIKGCVRCKLTTFDIEQNKFRETREPLNILEEIRFDEKLDGVVFGQNFCVDVSEDSDNVINVGDEVVLLD
jgi:uncharacterized protein